MWPSVQSRGPGYRLKKRYGGEGVAGLQPLTFPSVPAFLICADIAGEMWRTNGGAKGIKESRNSQQKRSRTKFMKRMKEGTRQQSRRM